MAYVPYSMDQSHFDRSTPDVRRNGNLIHTPCNAAPRRKRANLMLQYSSGGHRSA
jgi:hypothetical protein